MTGQDTTGAAPAAPAPGTTAGAFYQGERGAAYFARQAAAGQRAATMNMRFWTPHVRPTDTIVEFGCGAGDLLAALPGDRKVGVEINPAAAARARARGLEVHEGLASLPAATFSRAVSSHALEHVEAPAAVLRELRRVLRPGGELLLLLPLDDWRQRGQRHFHRDDFDMHLYAWTPLTLGNLLVASGFVPDEVRIVTHAWPPRIADALWRASEGVFHATARVTSVLTRKRQLFARARPTA
ncbi:MAG TPA: methyltransferase domain-containing protein [Gemmatirosa sp.]